MGRPRWRPARLGAAALGHAPAAHSAGAHYARLPSLKAGSEKSTLTYRLRKKRRTMKVIQKKVCLLGEFAVGKTSLVRRFVEGRFDDRYLSTIGVRISRKTLQRSGST